MSDNSGKKETETDRINCQGNAFIQGEETHSAQNRAQDPPESRRGTPEDKACPTTVR